METKEIKITHPEGYEIWKDIPGYEGLYQASNLGEVRSLDRPIKGKPGVTSFRSSRIIKPTIRRNYLGVTLHKDGKQRTMAVHRAVALAHIPNPDGLPIINHKDENKLNNRADNLEWCTHKYNSNYGSAIDRLKEGIMGKRRNHPRMSKKVVQIKDGIPIAIYPSTVEVERQLGIRSQNVWAICHGKKWKAGGYDWCYLENYTPTTQEAQQAIDILGEETIRLALSTDW